MSGNGAHPNKPRSVLCRRGALMRWTGWSKYVVRELVESGKLKTVRVGPNKRLFFVVESAQVLLD